MSYYSLLLKKKSAPSFGETFLLNSFGILSFLLTLRNNKTDKIEVSNNDLVFTIKNKVVLQKSFETIQSIRYNSIKEELVIDSNRKCVILSVKAFRIDYDEIKLLRHKINDLNKTLKLKLLKHPT